MPIWVQNDRRALARNKARSAAEQRPTAHVGGRFSTTFSDDYIAELQQEREGVGCAKYLDQAKDEIMEALRSCNTSKFAELSSGVMDKFPIRLTQTKSLLCKMKDEGLVDFTLPPRKRVPQDDTRIVLIPKNNDCP